jgi:hypothetical protein
MNKNTATNKTTDGFTFFAADVDLYYSPEGPNGEKEPLGFRGIVVEQKQRPADPRTGKVSNYYILRATDSFLVRNGKKEFVRCNVGDHVWVDERWSYREIGKMLPRMTPQGTVAFEVVYIPTEKVSIGGGRTAWRGRFGGKALSPAEHDLGLLGMLADAPAAPVEHDEIEG